MEVIICLLDVRVVVVARTRSRGGKFCFCEMIPFPTEECWETGGVGYEASLRMPSCTCTIPNPTRTMSVDSISKLVLSGGAIPDLKFGLRGDGKEEQCDFVTLWSVVFPLVPASGATWLRLTVPAKTRLGDVRAIVESEVGHKLDQPFVLDEEGFRFSKANQTQPVTVFSSRCKLRVDFSHDTAATAMKWATGKVPEIFRQRL
jgi:hypothetical protein